jgi:hypothetical protein
MRYALAGVFDQGREFAKIVSPFFLAPDMAKHNWVAGHLGDTLGTGVYESLLV